MAEHYDIKFLDESKDILTTEERENVITQTDNLKYNRSTFLDYIIKTELIIQVIIEDCVLYKKSKLKGVFRTNVLNKMNLNHKIALFLAIINEKKGLNDKDLKLLKSYLGYLRKERNKWAHGSIHFRQEKQGKNTKFQPYINWVNNGEEKETKLTNSYFDDLTNKFKTNRDFVVRILVKRGFLSKDYLKKVT